MRVTEVTHCFGMKGPVPGDPAELSCRGLANRGRFQRLVQKGVEQAAAGVIASGEARFQSVAGRQQFINLGYDAVLLCDGWEEKGYGVKVAEVELICMRAAADLDPIELGLDKWRVKDEAKELRIDTSMIKPN